jgi:putative DNA primase/helicase
MSSLQTITDIILQNQLYILPLYSIREEGLCSCGKEDCPSPGKHPLFRYNWKIIASNKPERVTDWLSAYKRMNFGLATGRLSKVTNKYLVVIDVDAAEHPFLDTLPETFSYRTGSGGHHLWFWSKYPVKNSVSLLADKVDVRGTDGYVVIPPSKHRKGDYNTINNSPIADLPREVLSKLFEPKAKQKETKPKAKQKTVQVKPTSPWATCTVDEVRGMMGTQLIPKGMRNVVLHRLLSSDRARGALEPELRVNANAYLHRLEEYPSFSATELEGIIGSVLKYPAYNNEHERTNELYVSWLKKNKGVALSTEQTAELTTTDNAFFALLQPSKEKNVRCTLKEITDARMAYMKSAGLKHISTYKQQLLAKKLRDMGFERGRTAKGNFWKVQLPEVAE